MSNVDPNVPTKVFDPTESVRILHDTSFNEEKMALREHQDTDKHYIGDSLPVASPETVNAIDVSNFVGESPFPARADHVHAYQGCFTTVYSTYGRYTPPGQHFFNNLGWTGFGRNLLQNAQLIIIPYDGLWSVSANLSCSRDQAGSFQNEVEVHFWYDNGTYSRLILKDSVFDIPLNFQMSMISEQIFQGATKNIQISIKHNDVSNWTSFIYVAVSYIGPVTSF